MAKSGYRLSAKSAGSYDRAQGRDPIFLPGCPVRTMLDVLSKITITCFFSSYLVVLVLELLRLRGRFPGRGLLVIGMMSIGLFTHICYLAFRAAERGGVEVGRLASWSDWGLLLALGLAICFFVFYLRHPETVISFFFLPAVIITILLSLAARDLEPFSRGEATQVWRTVHAVAMMVGSIAVLIGFLAGIMYLVQSWRLKHKRAGSVLKLPTLESSSRLNRQCLIISTTAVAIGLLAGLVMNLNRWGYVGWTDRGVLLSWLLLIWLLGATALEFFYAPASHGRKAVYLTLASLGFLILAMIGVLTTPHGQAARNQKIEVSRDAKQVFVLLSDPLSGRVKQRAVTGLIREDDLT